MAQMVIDKEMEGRKTTLFLSGRLDYNTSPDFEQAMLDAFRYADTLVIDLYKLHYLSSAGMRVLLAGQRKANKEEKTFSIVNVSKEIAALMETMGFTTIFKMQQADAGTDKKESDT
ncbi:STAS domain-containing protein [Ruminococcaceae bacterium OttesenSCG-928-I18]|nr:STAS domain-containing protein [Ruminococcaceae bacterium OttesenSCG-928-I18]